MARATFGGGIADTVQQAIGGGIARFSAATLTFWSAKTGGTQYTDLLVGGSPAATISVGPDGQVPQFQGPDGVFTMWADGGGSRVQMVAIADSVAFATAPTDTVLAAKLNDPTSASSAALNASVLTQINNFDFNVQQIMVSITARMGGSRPTRARITAIQALVSSLVGSGVWAKLDGLYVLAAHSEQAAKLNWVGCAQDLTAVNAPVFTIDRGYTGQGVGTYLDTNIAANALEKFAANDATLGVYTRTGGSSAAPDLSAGGASYINPNASGSFAMRANTGSGTLPSFAATIPGLFAWSRDATDVRAYKSGTQIGTQAVPTGSLPSTNVYALRDGAGTNYSTRQLSVILFGAGLTAAQHTSLSSAVQTYLTAVGA